MKKIFTLIMSIGVVSGGVIAQQDNEIETDVTHSQCTNFYKTPPLRDFVKTLTPLQGNEFENALAKDGKKTADWSTIDDHGIPNNNNMDPVAQLFQGTKPGAGMMKANWQAQGGAFPPDPSGAAGIDHYVQAVNSSYRVYNKDGSGASAVFGLSSLWSGSGSDGDPIVMYDRYADRWFISQFQTDGSNQILIAISETSDPLGAYYSYSFSFPSFPDYPKFGVWSNGYYMSSNSGSKNCVIFEREKMLLGDASASMVSMTFPSTAAFFRSFAPSYAEGPTEPAMDAPFYFFHVQDDSWSGVSTDHIRAFKVTVDWTTPSNSDVTVDQSIPINSLNTVFTNSWNDITQPGSSQKLDAVAGIFMYRAQYRVFDEYNMVLLTTTADVNGSNRAGVRWIELREDGDEQWYVYQEGTYSPGNNSRWMASAAMDLNGNIGMAYSFMGPSDQAGIRYTGRYAGDALGEMTVIEQIAVEGAGTQSGSNRFGDYSQMSVDPTDDATFWYTGEYLGSSGSRRTRIFSFAMWELLGEEENVAKAPFFNAFQPNTEELKVIWKDLIDEELTISIVDMNGKLIVQESNIDASINEKVFSIPSTATGVYFIKLTGEKTNLSEKIYLAK